MPIPKKKTTDARSDDDEELLAPVDPTPLKLNRDFVERTRGGSSRGWVWFFVILLLLGGGAYAYVRYQNRSVVPAETPAPDRQQVAAPSGEVGSVDQIVSRLSKHILLPDGEQPTIARVVDVEQLKQKYRFYAKAKNGDLLVVYGEWAVVYDPSADIIVNVAALDPSQPSDFVASSTPAQQPTTTAPVTLEIRNGSGVTGLAAKVASDLKSNQSVSVVKTGNAANQSYKATVIVDLGAGQARLQELAQSLKAQVVTLLPEGEGASQAQAVVILGSGG